MWGNYKVKMPKLENGFTLFDDDLYLNDFAQNLKKLVISQQNEKNEYDDDSYFVSGLGVKHEWSEPQEIGELTVGPYVVDIDIVE